MIVNLLYRGVAQPGESARFGTVRSVVQIHSPRPVLVLFLCALRAAF
mgnify:CR=1 FL=1